MKQSAVLVFLILFSLTVFAQKPKPAKKAVSFTKPSAVSADNEKDEFEKAVNQKDASERIMALNKFVRVFPNAAEKNRSLELIVSARAEIADEKLRLSDTTSGVELFTLAVRDAPTPVSDKLFSEILLQIPTNLFFRGQQAKAVEVARTIEQKIEGNAVQLLGLATFYIGTENAAEARRLAEKAIAINPNLPAAYQTLGIANRLNFQLEEAANAYSKALELDQNSTVSKRSLAEMKRAIGKSDEAATLYREILIKNESDVSAQTGLALALFDGDKRTEAEAEMQKLLAANPGNLSLLVGAAYWYAAHNEGGRAVELAQQAINVEPRYTWAYIALARGLVQQKRPLEAEKFLLTARQYGNFPTLDYEIASVRLAAGFYREAAEELKTRFTVRDGLLETNLGGRVPTKAKNFIELLALERRASIFEPLAADSTENADKIKLLFDFSQKLETADTSDLLIAEAAEEFISGDDKMKVHRQIFAASRLLEIKKALPKILEVTKAAVGGVDSALDAASPSAAILADELYDSRRIAMIRGQLIIVPDVPRQTLTNILRGRIEDISGWTLYQQGKTAEAVVRLKRAVSVLPEKSSWWRGSLWRLGTALDADGKSKDALEAYLKSYTNAEPDMAKQAVIETVYQKVNGNLEGLEEKLSARTVTASSAPNTESPRQEILARNIPQEIPAALTSSQPAPKPTIEIQPAPTLESKPTIEIQPTPTPEIKPTIEVQPSPTPEPTPELTPTPELKATPEPTPEIKLTPEVTPEIKITPEPSPELKPSPAPSPIEIKEQVAQVEVEKKPSPEPIAENIPVLPPVTKPNTEEKQPVENKESEIKPEKIVKPLFEPIIITVPKSETAKPEVKIDEAANEESSAKNNASTASRQRIATKEVAGSETAEIAPCKLITSQESVSLINNGGNLGILVGFEGLGDLKKLTASSDSPNDIEILLEPDIGAQSGRAFFLVKSISANKGVYTITFDAPCGKKRVEVKVR